MVKPLWASISNHLDILTQTIGTSNATGAFVLYFRMRYHLRYYGGFRAVKSGSINTLISQVRLGVGVEHGQWLGANWRLVPPPRLLLDITTRGGSILSYKILTDASSPFSLGPWF